jgi:hypothetical protein
MNTGALIFMLAGWTFVLSLTFWSYSKLLKTPPSDEHLPPPGSIP